MASLLARKTAGPVIPAADSISAYDTTIAAGGRTPRWISGMAPEGGRMLFEGAPRQPRHAPHLLTGAYLRA